jgi:hypothetical protein
MSRPSRRSAVLALAAVVLLTAGCRGRAWRFFKPKAPAAKITPKITQPKITLPKVATPKVVISQPARRLRLVPLDLGEDAGKLRRVVAKELEADHLPEVRGALGEVRAQAGKLESLEACREALRQGRLLPPTGAELAEVLAPVRASLQAEAALIRLRTVLAKRGTWAAHQGELKDALAGLRAAEGEATLADDLADVLAARAHAEGHPELARALLPPGHTLGGAARRTRDLTAAAAAGEVEAPPLLPLPLPEGPAEGVAAPVRESLLEDLPGLETRTRAAQARVRGRIEDRLAAGIDGCRAQLHHAVRVAEQAWERGGRAPARPEAEEDARHLAEVSRLLGRALTPAEGLLARHMRAQGKAPEACAAVLRDLPD